MTGRFSWPWPAACRPSTATRHRNPKSLPHRPRISLLEKRYFDMVELKRLFRVNLYHMQNKFPGDTKRKAREAAAKKARDAAARG